MLWVRGRPRNVAAGVPSRARTAAEFHGAFRDDSAGGVTPRSEKIMSASDCEPVNFHFKSTHWQVSKAVTDRENQPTTAIADPVL